MTQNYPLLWPQGWPRAKSRKRGQFKSGGQYGGRAGDVTLGAAVKRVFEQLRLLDVRAADIVISTNIRARLDGTPRSGEGEPRDPGAAVYWQRPGDPPQVMAIDIYERVAENIAALAATIEAIRAIGRHGGAQILERAFTGFVALPAPEEFDPWEVLGIPNRNATRADIEKRFRELAKIHHPDILGGDAEKFHRIQKAREICLATEAP
jgi:hypothetical protein